jgi:FkbM family methyltransferase
MKQLLKNILARAGYRVQGTRFIPRQMLHKQNLRVVQFDDVVCRRLFEVGSNFTFIQVGAFDGEYGDPLRKYIRSYPWRGIMVEPQARAAKKLRDLYKDNDRILVWQAAVDEQERRKIFYTVDPKCTEPWAGGLASFHREIILKEADHIPGLESMIREEIVDCITFDAILAKLPSGGLDLLQIDAEGADGHILGLFPFQRIRPSIVNWEVRHLSIRQQEDCLELLAGFGYRFGPYGGEDMIAVQL